MNTAWVLDRLSEPSTWTGLAGLLGAAGLFGISTGGWGTIVAAGMGIVSAVAVVKKEKGW
jgi:hypothetical protein